MGKNCGARTNGGNFVIKDMRTDINVPFVLNIDRDGMLDLVKTVMRKQNFKTTNMELPV